MQRRRLHPRDAARHCACATGRCALFTDRVRAAVPYAPTLRHSGMALLHRDAERRTWWRAVAHPRRTLALWPATRRNRRTRQTIHWYARLPPMYRSHGSPWRPRRRAGGLGRPRQLAHPELVGRAMGRRVRPWMGVARRLGGCVRPQRRAYVSDLHGPGSLYAAPVPVPLAAGHGARKFGTQHHHYYCYYYYYCYYHYSYCILLWGYREE